MAKEYTPASRNREAFAAMTDTPGNVPPQAVELEEAVLGALMLEKDSIITVQEFITPEAFYTEEHRTIYRAIEELSTELKPIDLYTVTERLKVRKELQKVGGASYLAQLTQKVGSAANVEFHAKIIAQKYVQRELIRSATEIQRRSYDESTDVTLCRERNLQGGRRSRQAFGTVVQGFAGQGADADRGGIQEHVGLQRRAFGFHGHRPRDARLAVVGPHHRGGTPFDG